MAEGESSNHPLGLPPEGRKGAGNAGGMETLEIYLKLAKRCLEAVQGMLYPKFNNEQCGYLASKLEAVVCSASLFIEDSRAHALCSVLDIARWVETSKFLLALARQVEGFVQGCCKEAWMQAAMTLANVAEYVSSLGFNLELCRVALSKVHAATGSLTLDEVVKISKDEAEIVETKAVIDAESLLKKATLELNSSKAKDSDLAKYLLHKLVRVGPNPTSDDDSVLVRLFEWVSSGPKTEQLGRGASAKVYKVIWLGTPVAKKTFDGPENQDFLQEVKILSQLCHPNITSMFCCNANKRRCSIIMELMDGNLHDMMQSRLEENSDSPPFSILEGVDIMLQVGEGVNYLHNKMIAHRDLKSMNILVKRVEAPEGELGYVQAKVVDFGLSKTKESSTTYSNMTYNMGTFRWMAPEVISLVASNQRSHGGLIKLPKHNFKSDIYSFGMVCFEILSGEVPFQCEGTPRDVKKKVLEGLRPKLPDYCPPMLKDLIEKCWSKDPMERPTIGDACSHLRHLKYLLMTSKMFHEWHTFGIMEPFEVVYLNVKNLPWPKQVQVNIFSPFLKKLLLVPNGTITIDGPQLFRCYEKVMERHAYCAAKLDSSEPSSSADGNCSNEELQHITRLVRFMDEEFQEIKHMCATMESERRVTWEMLWAFLSPGERIVYVDKIGETHMHGEVLCTDYQETEGSRKLIVKLIKQDSKVIEQDSNRQAWSKYALKKILHLPLKNKNINYAWTMDTHRITVHEFDGKRAFHNLDIHPVRFEKDSTLRDESLDLKKISVEDSELEKKSLDLEKISIEEVRVCTDNFGPKSLIGRGKRADVYHAPLQDHVVAIKRIYASKLPDSELLSHVFLVSSLKHENVVKLKGYWLENNLRVLAYEYATMGSLHDILHGKKGAQPGQVLNWMQRVKIAVGAAKGLEYLHKKDIIHWDIRSCNILLFDSYLAKIDDCFYSSLLNFEILTRPFVDCPHPNRPHDMFGHIAPESSQSGQYRSVYTLQSDVYSFGVVLLELLTGRKASDSTRPRGQQILVKWASPRLSEDKVQEVVDPKLGSDYLAKAVAKMAGIAAQCIQYEPDFRPNMSSVVESLQPLLHVRVRAQ
ncbi:hypothetical protein KC19_7G033300 [Ceratodon purpureus]|uniref:Protein kinase domain-containing protein n=1 Tax=Ceratodon purpureus TaxID=3225 RepID=A0A8T0H779_CERPU|nr:hypothetical protein KC19_7G033300 [Ceratodon purpureus]